MTNITPATMEIIRNALVSAAEEMSDTIVRTAHNPLLYDIKDFGVTILSPRGEMWAQASGLAVFLGALRGTVQTGIEMRPVERMEPGDVYLANCPYLTGTHLSDTAVYMPVFVEGRVVAFAATMAHWADIGGRSPGGWDPSSTDIYMEGLRFRHARLHRAGTPDEELYALIQGNVRLPQIVMGDLAAQIAACRTAARRIEWLCAKYGPDALDHAMSGVIANTRAALRDAVRALPDGAWAGRQRLDFDGVDRDYEPVVAVDVSIRGDRLIIDLTGSSGPSRGPINCPRIGAESVVLSALKGVFSPHEPTNEGHMSFAEFVTGDEPSLVDARAPMPCDSYGIVCRTLVETTIRVMAGPAPEQGRAGGYQMVGCYVMGQSADAHERFTYTEPVPGGYGGFAGHDGSTLVFGGDTPLLPIEVMETRYPLRCERLSFDLASAGAGAFRGGFGVRRDLRILQDGCEVKPSFESVRDPLAKGVDGGHAGRPARIEVGLPGGEHRVLDERPEPFAVPRGAVVSIYTGGGGGFGPPHARDPESVRLDVADGVLGSEEAREIYGVVLIDTADGLTVDAGGTAALRSHPTTETP